MKLGIVFEGGASRAFFSCGVMDALLEEHIIADYVIGASAGIANGVSYVSGQYGRNLAIGTKYTADKRYMGVRHLFDKSNRSFYNLQFVFDDIPNKYLPREAILKNVKERRRLLIWHIEKTKSFCAPWRADRSSTMPSAKSFLSLKEKREFL